tara:strand:+ start:142 stop:354 length:213 start_codon:yes stop_codon:yes gene_type:complete
MKVKRFVLYTITMLLIYGLMLFLVTIFSDLMNFRNERSDIELVKDNMIPFAVALLLPYVIMTWYIFKPRN